MSEPHLLDGPDNEATPIDQTEITNIGHYCVPDNIEVLLEPIFKKLDNHQQQTQSTSYLTSNMVPMETVITPVLSPTSDNEVGVVNLSTSVVLLMCGTVLFSTLIASLVSVIVAKVTSSKQKEIVQVGKILRI